MMEIKNQNLDNPEIPDQEEEIEGHEHFDHHQLDIEKIINQKIDEIKNRNQQNKKEVSPFHGKIKKEEKPKNSNKKKQNLITTEELDI